MRKLALVSLLAFSACTQQQVANVQAANTKALAQLQTVVAAVCQIDAQDQPIVVALAAPVVTAVSATNPTAGAAVAGAVALDTTVVHPDIVAACARMNAVPVAAVPAAKTAAT